MIFLYMTGGVSHVESFDPKPKLVADHGKTDDASTTGRASRGKFTRYLKRPQWAFRPRGECGHEVSDLFPHVGECVDDLCVIRSMHVGPHQPLQGDARHAHRVVHRSPGRASGSWVSYGLGTENRNLPSFVVLAPQRPLRRRPDLGLRLPARLPPGDARRPRPRADRRPPPPASPASSSRSCELDLLAGAEPPATCEPRRADPTSTARIQSFETAFGMQREAPEAFDLSRETDATLAPLRPGARPHRRASPGSAWSPAGWPSAASGSSS